VVTPLQEAKEKLPECFFEVLPTDLLDPFWTVIEKKFNLSPIDALALKKASSGTTLIIFNCTNILLA
jgi:hypothetical protein